MCIPPMKINKITRIRLFLVEKFVQHNQDIIEVFKSTSDKSCSL